MQGQGQGKVGTTAGDRLQASSCLNRQFRQFLKGGETVTWISTWVVAAQGVAAGKKAAEV